VIDGDGPTARAAVERLKPYRGRWERLAQAYRDLTGRDVEFGHDRLIEYAGPDRLFDDWEWGW
jgi:hypothetical protein